MTEHIIL